MKVLVLSFLALAVAAPVSAEIISGTVQEVNPDKNALTLAPMAGAAEQQTYDLTWNDDTLGAEELEAIQVGEEITVDADKGFFSRNWKVTAVNPEQGAEAMPAEPVDEAGQEAASQPETNFQPGNQNSPALEANDSPDLAPEEPETPNDVTPEAETLMQNAGESLGDAGETVGAASGQAVEDAGESIEDAGQTVQGEQAPGADQNQY